MAKNLKNETPRKCERCGSEVSGPTEGAVCKACYSENLQTSSRNDSFPDLASQLPSNLPKPVSSRIIGRYQLEAVVGEGASGVVYRATDTTLKRAVALKVPRLYSADPECGRKFLQEARAVARLRHPNIAMVYDSGAEAGTVYIASEYMEGRTLLEAIRDSDLPLSTTVPWIRDVARALQFAHERGIVHRDIKPANIIVGRDNRAVLTDFGIARRTDITATVTADGTILGTPAYMSPEQARGDSHNIGPLSDQYSLGIVFYELLTKQLPFTGTALKMLSEIVDKEPVPPASVSGDVPRELSGLCMKMLSKVPWSRFDNLQTVETLLNSWLAGGALPAFDSPPAHGRTRHWSIIVVAVLALLGSGIFWMNRINSGTLVVRGESPNVLIEVLRHEEVVARMNPVEKSHLPLPEGDYSVRVELNREKDYVLSAHRIYVERDRSVTVEIRRATIALPAAPLPPAVVAVPAFQDFVAAAPASIAPKTPESLAIRTDIASYPKATSSYVSPFDRNERANDGIVSYTNSPHNRWTSYGSPNPTDWLQIEFEKETEFGRVELFIFDEGPNRGVQTPEKYIIEYFDGTEWQGVQKPKYSPEHPTGNELNDVRFLPVTSKKLRVVFTHRGESRSGVTEICVWPK